jgi:type VI secretion system VasD/TssJ family lipoprotein
MSTRPQLDLCAPTVVFLALGLLTAMVWLGGCASATDRIQITSRTPLNSCDDSGSHAVILRIYSLKSADKFAGAEFTQLWEDDKGFLGDDLVDVETRTVIPGEPDPVDIPRPEGVRYIGLLANFCRLGQDSCWKRTVELNKGSTLVNVRLEGTCLRID